MGSWATDTDIAHPPIHPPSEFQNERTLGPWSCSGLSRGCSDPSPSFGCQGPPTATIRCPRPAARTLYSLCYNRSEKRSQDHLETLQITQWVNQLGTLQGTIIPRSLGNHPKYSPGNSGSLQSALSVTRRPFRVLPSSGRSSCNRSTRIKMK